MPFVRRSRDKRGYEHISLMHASSRRGKPAKPRLLYWFRTPPGVKVGREPFDETVRRTLEAQNPGVVFDWKKLSILPEAPPDIEHWRERRRQERAAKQARRAEQVAVSATPESDVDEADGEEPDQPDQILEAADEIPPDELAQAVFVEGAIADEDDDEPRLEDAPAIESEMDLAAPAFEEPIASNETLAGPSTSLGAGPSTALAAGAQSESKGPRRRRRRGGRRRRRKPGLATNGAAPGQPIQLTEDSVGAADDSPETFEESDNESKEE